jgi:hypothetical protein
MTTMGFNPPEEELHYFFDGLDNIDIETFAEKIKNAAATEK